MCLFVIISRLTRIYMDICLENPRERGAWWAAVYGVAQSRTQLMQLSSSSMPLIFYIFSIHAYVIMHKCFLFYILCVYVLMIKLSFKAHFSHFSELQQNLILLSGIISSLQFSLSVMSDSLQAHGLQHTRLSCPLPTPGACSGSCPSSW